MAAIYSWTDFVNNTYQFSICTGFYLEVKDNLGDNSEIQRQWTYFLIYKAFSCIPFTVFSSFIVVSLTYRTVVDAIDYILRKILYKRWHIKENNNNAHKKDSFCCNIFDVDDEHEIIFSKHDVEYVLDLMANTEDLNMKKNFKTMGMNNYSIAKIDLKNLDTKFKILDKILSGKTFFIYNF